MAATVQTATGFGFAIICMAILPILFPMTEVLIMVPFISVPIMTIVLIKNIRHINYRLLVIPSIIALIFQILGFRFVLGSDSVLIVRFLGGVLLLLCVYFFWFSHKIKIPVNNKSAFIAGLISGLIGGMFGIGGPPMALYCTMATEDKKEYLATIQAFFVVVLTAQMLYIIFFVGFTHTTMSVLPFAVGAGILGMLLGMHIFNRMNSDVIKKAVYLVMALFGLWFLLG